MMLEAGGSAPDLALDLSGLRCPAVVLALADRMRGLHTGARLAVVSTDPLSAIDIPVFLRRNGHSLLERRQDGARLIFSIEAGAGR